MIPCQHLKSICEAGKSKHNFHFRNFGYLILSIFQKPRSLPSKNQAQKYLFHEVYDALLVVEAKVPGVEESLGVSGVVLPALVAPHQLDCLHAQLTL